MKDIKKIKEVIINSLNEIGDASIQPYPFTSEEKIWQGEFRILFNFTTDKDIKYTAALLENYPSSKKEYEFSFRTEEYSFKDVINKGELFKVMSTIVAILKKSIDMLNSRGGWNKISFAPSKSFKGDERRANLYKSYILKNLPSDVKVKTGVNKITFINQNPTPIKEMKDIKKIQEFFSKILQEGTAIDMAKKQLDALGVKYEMSKTDKVRPFKVIYKPTNKPDDFYDKFNKIVDEFNLRGFVKSSMSEASKEEETKFHKKLDTLVHNTFGKRKGELEEEKLTEANVPSNIADFAKRKGVSSLVRKVAGWAEKVGARIAGGTAVGKNYSTLVLDLDYKQQGEIRINTDMETVTLYNKPVTSFPEFKRVYEANKPVDEASDYMKRKQKDLAEAILSKLKK
jgi:hypothetical protein